MPGAYKAIDARCDTAPKLSPRLVLGSLDSSDLIVVVGRNNYKKTSASLDALLHDLHSAGYSICWFEPRHRQVARWRDRRFARLLNGRLSAWCKKHPLLGRHLRQLTKTFILLVRPDKWIYFSKYFYHANRLAAGDLHELLVRLPSGRAHLFTHSAGGIVASQIASTPAIASIVCFGYPFKHPDHDEEPIRTMHLPAVSKPFLIFQGDRDEYGTAQDARRYRLSGSTIVESVASGHGYGRLEPAEYHRCLRLLKDFLRQGRT